MSDTKETPPIHGPEELKALRLLKEVQQLLANVIKSLEGHSYNSKEQAYVWWACVSVNRAAEGYLYLRESGRTHASKLFVRPALEPVFAAHAISKKRGFWFRKAYTESLEDQRFVKNDATALAAVKQQLEDLKTLLQKDDSTYPIECKQVDGRFIAEVAGLVDVYDTTYRLYCQYTHGAFRAVEGGLDEATDSGDTGIVSWSVLQILDLMQQHSPVPPPDLIPFKKRLLLLAGL